VDRRPDHQPGHHQGVLLPSLVSMLVPLAIVAYVLRGRQVVARAGQTTMLGSTTEFDAT
jgi:hypothetical protein